MATPAQTLAQIRSLGSALMKGPKEGATAGEIKKWMADRLTTIQSLTQKDPALGGDTGEADFEVAFAQLNRSRGFKMTKAPDSRLGADRIQQLDKRHEAGVLQANAYNRAIATSIAAAGVSIITAVATGGATSPAVLTAVIPLLKTIGEQLLNSANEV